MYLWEVMVINIHTLFVVGALVKLKLSPSCLIDMLHRSSYRVAMVATPHDY